ncbi:MAG: hypothetical protein ACM3SQ_20510 [Betaproteobacteria bacterium]
MRVLAALVVFALSGIPVFQVSAPATVIDLDQSTFKGDPVVLAWSADGQFYIETAQGDAPHVKLRHYLVKVGDRAPKSTGSEPKWASEYWAFKSTRNTPARPNLMIEVRDHVEHNRIPTQSLAQKAQGTETGSVSGMMEAANDYKNGAGVRNLLLGDHVISTIIDAPLVPGTTFGWSPARLQAVAYVDERHRLRVFEYVTGEDLEVPGTKDVLLPAWSPQGDKIVFLERTGRDKYALTQISISRM